LQERCPQPGEKDDPVRLLSSWPVVFAAGLEKVKVNGDSQSTIMHSN
jgi:hypothetical protein